MRPKYYAGTGARFYYYDSDPLRRCPVEHLLTSGQVTNESSVLHGVDFDLVLVLRRAHRSGAQVESDSDPTRCRQCGAELETIGYPSWVEEPWPSEKEIKAELKATARVEGWDDDKLGIATQNVLSSRAVSMRLGATHRRASSRTWPTKKQAIEWARDSARYEREDARKA